MKKKRDYKPAAYILAAFLAGGGSALLYVFAHPVQVYVTGRTQCTFVWPDGFMGKS